MAISKTIEYKGLQVEGAYIKIKGIKFTSKTNMLLSIGIFSNSKAEESICIDARSCHFDINGDNPFAQGYEHIKTLEEFKDSKDV